MAPVQLDALATRSTTILQPTGLLPANASESAVLLWLVSTANAVYLATTVTAVAILVKDGLITYL